MGSKTPAICFTMPGVPRFEDWHVMENDADYPKEENGNLVITG